MSERDGSSGVLIAVGVAGGIILLAAAACCGIGVWTYSSARRFAQESVEQFEKEQAEERARFSESAAPPSDVPADPVPGPLINTPHDQPVAVGDVIIRVISVSRSKVPVETTTGQEPSNDEHLLIRLSVENTSQTTALAFKPWNQPNDLLGPYAGLNDDLGNIYARVDIGDESKVPGQEPDQSIEPGKSAEAALTFELPVDAAKTLMLVLPAQAVGQGGQLRFEIPVEAIEDR